MNRKIREMVEQDINEVVRIISFHDSFDGRCAALYFADYFSNPKRIESPDEKNFVVVEEGKVVGVSGYTPDQYTTPGIYWLGWTYIDKDFRRRGLGYSLLQKVIEQVCIRGARKLYVDTSSHPIYKAARAFYKRFGFHIEGVLKNYYGKEEDYLILGKELQEGEVDF